MSKTTPLVRLTAAAAIATAVGCGGNSSSKKPAASTAAPVTSAITAAPVSTAALNLLSSTPSDGTVDVLGDQALRLELDLPVDLATVGSGVLAEVQGSPLPISAVGSGTVIEVRPQGDWPAGERVTVTLTREVRSSSGLRAQLAKVSFEVWQGAPKPTALRLPEGALSASASVELVDGGILLCGGEAAAITSGWSASPR